MALVIEPELLARRAVRKGNVVIRDVVEKMYLVLLEHESRGNAVHGRVAPTLVEEAARAIQVVEVVNVGFGAEPIEVADFKVGPLFERKVLVSSFCADLKISREGERAVLTKWQ